MSTDKVNFNLDKGKYGKVDLNQIKGGIKRKQIEQMKDKNLLAIFDALDDGNKVLDKKEVDNLKLMLQQYAKDNNLSKREAGKYLKNLFGKKSDITKEDLYKFINTINEGSKDVKSSTVNEENGNKVIQIEYKDGSIEKFIPEQGKRITIKDGKTSTYDAEDNLQKEEYFDKDGNSIVTTFENGKPKKSITTLKDNAGVETVDYEDGKQKSKTVKNNEGTSYFDENNSLTKRVSNNGVQTDYEYGEDGSVQETETRENVTVKSVKKDGKVLSQHSVEKVGDTTVETITDENGNVTKNTLNSEGKRIRQEKTVDGETYTVEYDGNGNTKIIVQNGESIAKIAKIFDVKPGDIIELNGNKVKGKGSNKYFLVGEEALIPKELEADDPALRGRKSSDEAKGAYADAMEARERKRREEQEAKDEVTNRKPISFTCGQKTYEELAKQLYKNEGVANPSKRQIELRIADLKKSNPTVKDGELKGKKLKAGVSQEIYDRIVGKQKEAAEINRNIKINKTAKGIAANIYKICDDNAAAANKKEFWAQLNQINKDNVIAVLDNYDKVLEKHTGDSSLLDTICSEIGSSSANRQKALNHIYNSLEQAAKAAGVSDAELKNARKKFSASLKHEFDKLGRVDTKEMDKVVDFLRGATAAAKVIKQNGDKDVSTKDAMKTFLNGEDGLIAHDKNAQKMYKDARDAEGWVAKTGDWVCGLFGCTTIADMDKKLGKHAADVKKLVAAANKNDEAEFKKIYKQVFGIDFNPKAIQARQTAKENFEAAAAFDSSHKAFATLENKTKNMDYNGIRNEIKKSFQYSDSDMDAIIDSYAEQKGLSNASAQDKKYILNQFIKESRQTYLKEFQKLSKGKTLEQMGQDVDLLTKSAYGTNDIVKDVMKFNENQVMTDMVTSAAFEIAGTIALQFVPGLGQLAAAKLAVSAAKWGVKGVKIANYASKAQKALSTVSTAMNATKKAKIISSVATTGVATATVNLTNKKSVEETLRKTLMNMSFAGVGVSSSILAPKLMKSFGIVDKALANEVAEEIINIAGSYGVTKIAGDNYGETDAFIDFASGLLISRLAHVKTGKHSIDPTIKPDPTDPHGSPVGPDPHGTKPTVDPADPHGTTVDPADPHGSKPTVDPADPNKTNPIDPNEPQGKTDVGPTPENPQKMTFFDAEVEVIKIEINKKGQKVLHTNDGIKLTLDEHDRPIMVQDKDFTGYYTYGSSTDKDFTVAKFVNKKNQVLRTVDKNGDTWIDKDYEKGIEQIKTADMQSTISEKYIPLSDYPVNAVIPDADTFSKLLHEQIDKCTDQKMLNTLKSDYSLYNSQYGALDGDLFKKFQLKEKELAGIVKPDPHKPLSDLITGTTLDNALQNLNLKKYGKKGLPLKYSHEAFMADLEQALKDIPDAERMQLMSDLNIKLKMDIKSGHYELADIPKLPDIAVSPNHEKILNILNKYAKQNELQISDPALKAELEKFIKDVPEFSFMIGKPQNSLHAYSLDSHTLQNLQKALNYAEKAGISPEQKEILKMSILLHDIGKQFKGSNVSDTGHAALSKAYAESILERFNYPQTTKDKILNLIENHHWFKEFNKGNMTPEQVLATFGDDIELAKIMAKADLESVSDDFHLTILEPGKTLSQAEYETKFQQKMDELNPAIKPELIGQELPVGPLETYKPYVYDPSKMDKLLLGTVEIDFNDPTLKKLMSELKEGESFAIGNTTTSYADVKYKIGTYADGVGSHHVIITKKQGQIVIDVHKPASVIKDIPTKISSDPAIAKKIDKLRKQASSISTKSFIVNGKQTPFEILHGTKSGSNTGYYVINKETGELFYAKESEGGNKLQAEMAAAQLYAAAGIDVPEVSVFKASDGTSGILSKYVPELNSLSTPHALANDGFGMDVLLNNWDVVGTGYDNILITADGKRVVRIDAGGSFDYHAKQTVSKPFGAIPTELITLLDPSINPYSTTIFGKMSRADMIKSLEKAANLKVGDITSILNNAGVGHYADTLLARRKFIKTFLEQLKSNPQGSESTLAYMRKMMGKALDQSIANAKNKGELEDIKNALKVINSSSEQIKLRNSIDKKLKELESIAPKVVSLSETQVKNLLEKNGFAYSTYGYAGYKKVLTDAEKQDMYLRYGEKVKNKMVSKIEKSLTSDDIVNIQKMLNGADGQFLKLYQSDMNMFIYLYQNIKNTNIFDYMKEMGPGEWETVVNILKNPPSWKVIESFDTYKGAGYQPINKALWQAFKLKDPSIVNNSSFKKDIENLSSYISTQVINSPITVRRNEGYGKLMTGYIMPSGKDLDFEMRKAEAHFINTGDRSLIDKIEDYVLNSADEVKIHAAGFMSASIAGPAPNISGENVQLHMTVEKGSKGALLEGLNPDGGLKYETEILLQKDSEVVITGIKYESGHWQIEAELSN